MLAAVILIIFHSFNKYVQGSVSGMGNRSVNKTGWKNLLSGSLYPQASWEGGGGEQRPEAGRKEPPSQPQEPQEPWSPQRSSKALLLCCSECICSCKREMSSFCEDWIRKQNARHIRGTEYMLASHFPLCSHRTPLWSLENSGCPVQNMPP